MKLFKLICSVIFGLVLLSSCVKVEPSDVVDFRTGNGYSHMIEIHEFQYKEHDYLRIHYRNGAEMNIVHNPDCRKCKEY